MPSAATKRGRHELAEHAQEQQQVHQEYVRLQYGLQQGYEELVKSGTAITSLEEAVDVSASLLRKAESTQHMVDDSSLVFTATGIIRRRAGNTKVDTTRDFDVKEYVTSLHKLLSGRKSTQGEEKITSVEDLGTLAYKYMNRGPTVSFMAGPLGINHQRKTRKAGQNRLVIGKESAPTNVKDTYHGDDDAEQAELIITVYETLVAAQEQYDGEPVQLLEFILNPWSFSETIENLFFVSFLVKEGRVTLDMDEDGIPVISTVDGGDSNGATAASAAAAAAAASKSKKGHSRTQLVVDLDMKSWIDLCNIFDMSEPVIPARNNADTRQDREQV